MNDTERQVEVPWLLGKLQELARPEHTAVDIGSVDSEYVDEFASRVGQLWLVDPRPSRVSPGGNKNVLAGLAGKLPEWMTATFDIVTSVSVFDHIGLAAYGQPAEDGLLEAAARDIARITKVGGHFLFTVPYGRAQVTTHPGGGQRVFDWDLIDTLFPSGVWALDGYEFFKREGERYVPAWDSEVDDAEYGGHRANAVICAHFIRL